MMMKSADGQEASNLVFDEIQLLLAEKRTAFSSMRTGIAVFALPLTVLSFLVLTSRYYEPLRAMPFLVPLLALSAGLVALGVYLIAQSMRRVRHYDRLIARLKDEHRTVAKLIE